MTTVEQQVTEPGVYNLPAATYHADPVPGGSLSHSGARKLLAPSCPALFQQWVSEGGRPTATFDLGHAAHAIVLGVGAPIVVVDAEDWRTNRAKAERVEAHAAGATPLLRADYDQVRVMADALLAHPWASLLLQPGSGLPERSLFWPDEDTGVWRRAMLDWLPFDTGSRLIIPDYKTTVSAHPGNLSSVLYKYGYYQQAAWYLDGVRALNLSPHDDPAFTFIFQEKTPPYLVTVVQPHPDAVRWGQVVNRKAIDVYRRCKATGQWPGYSDDKVVSVTIPSWADYQLNAGYRRGDYDIDENEVEIPW